MKDIKMDIWDVLVTNNEIPYYGTYLVAFSRNYLGSFLC